MAESDGNGGIRQYIRLILDKASLRRVATDAQETGKVAGRSFGRALTEGLGPVGRVFDTLQQKIRGTTKAQEELADATEEVGDVAEQAARRAAIAQAKVHEAAVEQAMARLAEARAMQQRANQRVLELEQEKFRIKGVKQEYVDWAKAHHGATVTATDSTRVLSTSFHQIWEKVEKLVTYTRSYRNTLEATVEAMQRLKDEIGRAHV